MSGHNYYFLHVLHKDVFDTTEYNDVPVLMLTGSTEFSLFSAFASYFASPEMTALDEDTQAAAKKFAIKYGSAMYRIFNAQCSADKMDDENYKSNMYICQVNYGSDESASHVDTLGAFHGIFAPMLTPSNGYTAYIDRDQAGYADMSSVFDSYLTNFLATGDPNGDSLETWNNWTPDQRVSMVLDADDTSATAELKDVTTTYDAIIADMDADDTISDDVKADVIKNVMNGRWFSSTLDEHYGNPSLWK